MDTEIADIAEALIELAGNAKEIFTSSKPLAKNQFLKILVSNCILDNKKARISLIKTFNLLLKTPSCLMWSGRLDSNQRLLAPHASALPG